MPASAAIVLTLIGAVASAPRDTIRQVPLYDNLGNHHYAISTQVPQVQAYFDQGLRLYYAFNHAEAIRAFREAQRIDSACAMCFWGEALARGPNINAAMDSTGAAGAYAAVLRAQALRSRATGSERDLIEALAARYAEPRRALADRAALDTAYARAMLDVIRRHPSDPDAAVLYAEAWMDLRPWNYWTAEGLPQPGTTVLLFQLERVLAQHPEHPGACHFYIHAVEAARPERAVSCAERLARLMPGAGHIVHMPGHIYVRVGRYLDAVRANEHAVHADERFIRDQRPGAGMYTAGYYPHNYDFLSFAAAMAGRSAQAIEAADKLAEVVPREMLGTPGMTYLEHHITRNLQMRVRFGRWDEILANHAPAEHLLHARAMWHYARGRAFAARSQYADATSELSHLRGAVADPKLAGVRMEYNESLAVLRIAEHVLAGDIASRSGRHDEAIAELRTAVELEDGLTYGEPPEWSVPVRHDFGAALLASGRAADAERAYREDLARFPRNGWSLKGLILALDAQRRHAEAEPMESQLRLAWEGADVEVTGSRY